MSSHNTFLRIHPCLKNAFRVGKDEEEKQIMKIEDYCFLVCDFW
jgi:hypothetical protein